MEDNEKIKVAYDLPTSLEPFVFGPDYWFAFHDLARRIPCGGCKKEAESFLVFFHDYKNYELGKKIYDKKNFINWINKISKLKTKVLILK